MFFRPSYSCCNMQINTYCRNIYSKLLIYKNVISVDTVNSCRVSVNVTDCLWLAPGSVPDNVPQIPNVSFRRRSLSSTATAGVDRSNQVVNDIVKRLSRHERLLEEAQQNAGVFKVRYALCLLLCYFLG